MFHPGKVIKVLNGKKEEVSADGETQAVIVMWDDNLITMPVHKKLKSKIKEGDVVLADYRPMEKINVPVPRQLIMKILRGKKAKEIWTRYTEYHEKRQRSANRQPTAPQGYIG